MGFSISHSCFSTSSIFLPKSYSGALQHLCCLPKWLLTGCCQEYSVSICDIHVSDLGHMKGYRSWLLRRRPATQQSSGQVQPGSLTGDFAVLTDSALQVLLLQRRVNSPQQKRAFIFTCNFLLLLPSFKQQLSQIATVLSPSHPKCPSFSKIIPPRFSAVDLSFNPILTLGCLMTFACYPSLKQATNFSFHHTRPNI